MIEPFPCKIPWSKVPLISLVLEKILPSPSKTTLIFCFTVVPSVIIFLASKLKNLVLLELSLMRVSDKFLFAKEACMSFSSITVKNYPSIISSSLYNLPIPPGTVAFRELL